LFASDANRFGARESLFVRITKEFCNKIGTHETHEPLNKLSGYGAEADFLPIFSQPPGLTKAIQA